MKILRIILALLLGWQLNAGNDRHERNDRITISTTAESGDGCKDGTIIINSRPEGQNVCVKINPGNLRFDEFTPVTVKPDNSSGFTAGKYDVHVSAKGKGSVHKVVEICLARYSVTVLSTNAHLDCNGSFSTVFNNPDNADVTVTYQAFDSTGNAISGTNGVYSGLCPGEYHWTVQANSKSTACNEATVFHDSNTVVIGGTGPIVKPTLTPQVQTVPVAETIRFQVEPVQSFARYVLHTPARGNITQMGNGTFVLMDAQCTDAGGYFVQSIVENEVMQSDPVTVFIDGTCNLAVGLNATASCGNQSAGQIDVSFTGGSGSVNFSVNGTRQPGPVRSPFTIPNLAAGTYTISLTDSVDTHCTNEATIDVKPVVPAAPTLTFQAQCTGQPLVFTITPPGQGPFQTFTLYFPDGTSQTQINNIFTITNATEEQNGNYSASYTDANGCESARSPIVPVTIQSGVIAMLSPSVQVVPQFGTITLTLAPFDPSFIYQIQTPNPNRGVKGVLTQVGNPTFTITGATQEDMGTYFGLINAQGCVSPLTDTVTVTLGGTCDMTVGLTQVPACSSSGQGSIIVSFTGGSGTVNFTVNGAAQPGPVKSPFTISNLAPNNFYTITLTDVSLNNCSNTASILLTAEQVATKPVLTATSTCEGGTLTLTVAPAGQAKYVLTLPNNTTMVQTSNVFTIKNAGPANNGNYFATFIDAAGCRSGSSNIVNIKVSQPTIAQLFPMIQTVTTNGTIRFTALHLMEISMCLQNQMAKPLRNRVLIL